MFVSAVKARGVLPRATVAGAPQLKITSPPATIAAAMAVAEEQSVNVAALVWGSSERRIILKHKVCILMSKLLSKRTTTVSNSTQ